MGGYHLFSWSGGKDSALALRAVLAERVLPVRLFTTVTEGYERVSMHGVRIELLREQADALGMPLDAAGIPAQCSNEVYAEVMRKAMSEHKARGCQGVIFGDLYLADVRAYRERNLARAGLPAVFPLWGRDTRELARQFISDGFKAVVVCVDGHRLDGSFAGRQYDEEFLRDLPAGIDPCAENGEFHTFVYDGPIFNRPVRCERGEIVLREGRFYYCDLKKDRGAVF